MAAVISEMQTDRCLPLLQTKPRATSTRLPGLTCLYASRRRSSTHVQTSLISPFMLLFQHMPRMLITLVPRWREADPSVSRRHRVSTTCVNSQVVSSRRTFLRAEMPGSFHQSDWLQSRHLQSPGTSRMQSRRFLHPRDVVHAIAHMLGAAQVGHCAMRTVMKMFARGDAALRGRRDATCNWP